ncbi:hypothetical protein FRB94_003782, partial [Tulasnella sp. JGI-2019a]
RDNTIKSKNTPHFLCHPCGSPHHFDNNCLNYAVFKQRNVASVNINLERLSDVQQDYNLDYTISDMGLMVGDLEMDTYTVHSIQYDQIPSLPGQCIDWEANTIWGLMDYEQFHNHGPEEGFLAKWPKDMIDKSALAIFTKEEPAATFSEGEPQELEVAELEEPHRRETMDEEGKLKVKIKWALIAYG